MPTRMITWPLTRAITNAITQAGAGGGGAAFTPDATFFAGASGFAYDPSDYSTMFQDSAGATPVTATGQSLGRINDLSGNGNHRTQATGAKKPLTVAAGYQCDGFDDGMSSACNTAAGGAWTHLIRLNIGADTSGVLMYGNNASNAFFAVYQSGSGAGTSNGATITEIKVDGSATTNTRAALFTALTAANRTMVTRISALTHAEWASVVKIGDYAGFTSGATIGREIFINRDLSAGDLASAIAWINS